MNLIRRSAFPFLLFIISLLIVNSSCQHKSDILDTFPAVCFESQVLPIFQTSCAIAGCHDNGGGEAGFSLSTYDGILSSVVPGDPEASPSYAAIIKSRGEGRMPPSQPISEQNRTLIRLWIYQGAANTVCSTDGVVVPAPETYNARACFSRDILPVLLSSCAISGCHDATSRQEGYIYTSYATTMGSVRAGSPAGSKLYQVITTTSGESRMPPLPYNRLTSAAIDSVYSWIRNGALNETCGELCDTTSTVSFNTTLWPVIQNSCKGCHSGTTPSGGIRLESYANVATVAANGSLLGSLKGTAPYSKMPPGSSLTACRITQFSKWIANGYPNN